MSRAQLAFLLSMTLAGCGSAETPAVSEVDGGAIEGPALGPRFCTPGSDDPLNCKTCNASGVFVSWCAAGEFCYMGTCKIDTKSAGSSCGSSKECATAFCTDGVCCNVSVCSGGCEFCGFGGACQIKTGLTPKSCSLAGGAAPCGATGCFGAKDCSYAPNTTACTPKCVGTASTGFTYGGSGTCDGIGACKGTGGSTSCGNYQCADATGCKTTCSGDVDCIGTAYCDAGTCKPKLTTGSPCTADSSCASGAGTCKATADGKRCCTASCASPMVCDSTGTSCVGTLPIGSTCSSGSVCATGKCHPTGKCAACTGDSDCATIEFCDVVSLKCVPRAGVGKSCTSTAACPTGLFCTEGVCCEKADCGPGSSCALEPKGKCMKDLATGCSTGAECASGSCVDGVCCDGVCTGQCEACNVVGSVGKCVAVKGAPRGARPACPGAEVSVCERATCDGADRASCKAFTSSDEPCRSPSCTGGNATAPANCTGTGSCPAPITSSCGGFACDAEGKACRTACANDGDCIDGYVCNGGKCEPKTSTCSDDFQSSKARDGTSKACAPYRCDPSSGNCFEQCSNSDQCGVGFVCDGTTCVAAPSDTGGDGGCAYGGSSRGGAGIALLAVLLGIARRSRATGRCR